MPAAEGCHRCAHWDLPGNFRFKKMHRRSTIDSEFCHSSNLQLFLGTAPNLLTCNSTGRFLTAFTPVGLQEKGLLPKMSKDGSQTIVKLTCFETTPSQWTSFEETILAVQVVDEFNEFTSEISELYHDGIPPFISKLETGFLKISIEIHGS